MRLLFLTPQLPYPPNKGTAIRNFNLIKGLAAKHEIWLLSFAGRGRSEGDLERNTAAMRQYCAHVETVPLPRRRPVRRLVSVGLSPLPDLAHRFSSPEFVDRLAILLRTQYFDLVQIEGLEMAHLLLDAWRTFRAPSRSLPRRPRLVLDAHNAEYVLQRRAFQVYASQMSRWHAGLYFLLQWRKLVFYERSICRRMDGVAAVSDVDREQLLHLAPEADIQVVPNGVDLEHFQVRSLGALPLGDNSVVFTGTMDFRPNVDGVTWFTSAVWPQVLAQVPEARFYIVGRSPKLEIQRLDDDRSVFVTGAVRDIRPYLLGATISAIPLRVGGGSRLKILEAMAAGVPMVSTALGAEGIDVTPGENIVIANNPEAFAHEIAALLSSPERRQALVDNARQLVATHYDWPVILPRLEKLYARLA